MKMRIWIATVAAVACPPLYALDCAQSPLNHDEKRLLGGTENICESYGGNVILVVNTASHCGYTPQYEGLEKLYKTYRRRGFVILGFPSNEFLQEWDDEKDIAKFCTANYGVSFPMYGKTAVRGNNADPFYKDLKAATGVQPSWNFNKYLISRDGKILGHYASDISPDNPDFVKLIESELLKPVPAAPQRTTPAEVPNAAQPGPATVVTPQATKS